MWKTHASVTPLEKTVSMSVSMASVKKKKYFNCALKRQCLGGFLLVCLFISKSVLWIYLRTETMRPW